jgi:hypothetical protein
MIPLRATNELAIVVIQMDNQNVMLPPDVDGSSTHTVSHNGCMFYYLFATIQEVGTQCNTTVAAKNGVDPLWRQNYMRYLIVTSDFGSKNEN